MKLFKKIIKSLFKFVVQPTLYVVTHLVNFMIWIERILVKLTGVYSSNPSKTNEEYLNDMREEYKDKTNSKDIVVD